MLSSDFATQRGQRLNPGSSFVYFLFFLVVFLSPSASLSLSFPNAPFLKLLQEQKLPQNLGVIVEIRAAFSDQFWAIRLALIQIFLGVLDQCQVVLYQSDRMEEKMEEKMSGNGHEMAAAILVLYSFLVLVAATNEEEQHTCIARERDSLFLIFFFTKTNFD